LTRTLDVPLKPQTYAFGRAFEHMIICEFFRLSAYQRNDFQFSYLRTKDDAEIDLIVERPGMPVALVEIKSTPRVTADDVASLKRFLSSFPNAEAFCLSLDQHAKNINGVECLYWSDGIRQIFD